MSTSVSAASSSNYYNYNSSLFSSLSSSSGTSDTTSLLSQYSSIKNGSYKKALVAYYAAQKSDSSTKDEDVSNWTSTKGDSASLAKSTSALLSSDLWNKTETTDETTGKKTSSYDMNSIYNAVSSFVKSYNSTIDSSADQDNTSILRKASSMTSETSAYENLLNDVGITINSDNSLSVNETDFKKADINDIKTLFNGSNSYAQYMNSSANAINTSATSLIVNATGASAYTNSGTYVSSLSTGNLLDSLV